MGVISINNMEFYAFHGCFAEEQRIGTHFRVDLAMQTDTSKAQQSDNINDTVNYLSVYNVVKTQMLEPSHLLERVADRIGAAVLCNFPNVESVQVAVYKLNPPLGGAIQSVSVTIEKYR